MVSSVSGMRMLPAMALPPGSFVQQHREELAGHRAAQKRLAEMRENNNRDFAPDAPPVGAVVAAEAAALHSAAAAAKVDAYSSFLVDGSAAEGAARQATLSAALQQGRLVESEEAQEEAEEASASTKPLSSTPPAVPTVTTGGACQILGANPKCVFEEAKVGNAMKVKLAQVGTLALSRVTNMKKCKSMEKAKKLEPSARGVYGPGIYFAESCEVGWRKMDAGNRKAAAAEGGFCCISAQVKLMKAVMPLVGVKSSWLTTQVAKKMGADSVWVKANRVHEGRNSAPEYMIFKPDQVAGFKVAAWTPPTATAAAVKSASRKRASRRSGR